MKNKLKELENNLALYGADLSNWDDAKMSKDASWLIEGDDQAKKIYEDFKLLDKSLMGLRGDTGLEADEILQAKIIKFLNSENNLNNNALDQKSQVNNQAYLYYIFKSKIFSVVAVLVVAVALFQVFYNSGNQVTNVAGNNVAEIDEFVEFYGEVAEDIEYYEYSISALDDARIDVIESDFEATEDIEYILQGV